LFFWPDSVGRKEDEVKRGKKVKGRSKNMLTTNSTIFGIRYLYKCKHLIYHVFATCITFIYMTRIVKRKEGRSKNGLT
jgi:hypothetical protein